MFIEQAIVTWTFPFICLPLLFRLYLVGNEAGGGIWNNQHVLLLQHRLDLTT